MEKKTLAKLHADLEFEISINQCYHQRMASIFGWIDRALKIIVGIIAVASVAVSMTGYAVASAAISIIGLIVAIALNLSPVDKWGRQHLTLFQRWTDLHKDVERLEMTLLDVAGTEGRKLNSLGKDFGLLNDRRHEIEEDEPTPWTHVLKHCQHNENERRWGPGVRTYEQAKAAEARANEAQGRTNQSPES